MFANAGGVFCFPPRRGISQRVFEKPKNFFQVPDHLDGYGLFFDPQNGISQLLMLCAQSQRQWNQIIMFDIGDSFEWATLSQRTVRVFC